uniref:Uncharacterized protein n=1 Tax=Rhizophora mucronata TaxID=61149 RepID=A0A2P2PZE3_RHIMU
MICLRISVECDRYSF